MLTDQTFTEPTENIPAYSVMSYIRGNSKMRIFAFIPGIGELQVYRDSVLPMLSNKYLNDELSTVRIAINAEKKKLTIVDAS